MTEDPDRAGRWPDELLDRMQYVADPLADAAVARIVGPWPTMPPDATREALRAVHQAQWQRLAAATRLLSCMQCAGASSPCPGRAEPGPCTGAPNATSLAACIGDDPGAPGVGEALRDFVAEAGQLPDWIDAAKVERAEELFFGYGALSCVLLFCASLPECYVIPDLAVVLNASGQLEKRTDYRIRMTAAMIFPVMMRGGLAPHGSGVAQVLKVRLIHATIRSLILHETPQRAVEALGADQNLAGAGVVPAHPALAGAREMYETMSGHGWRLGEDGLPCNQEELAYTLLTFGYVFLRSLRRLGIGLARADEEAFLHCWNVAGHILGIGPELMVHNMDDAALLFARLQARGRADPATPDPRPLLGRALVATMEQPIPFALLKPFPRLMLRYLCGRKTARDLGLGGPVHGAAAVLFAIALTIARAIDATVRLVVPDFSISRFLTRVIGYRFVTRVLMDQTRPLALPLHLRTRIAGMMDTWGSDPKAPGWMNSLEDRFTTTGSWRAPAVPPPHSG